jgi:3-methyl-2-oxobutanoate hydroxymethyltransferase
MKKVTTPGVIAQKNQAKLTMLTAYDYPTAVHLDEAGVDMLLVGDSLGSVIYGDTDTLSVTMDDMIRHTLAVSRGAKRALVVSDLPFMSYQVSPTQAVENSGRLLKEGRAAAVKLEGGAEMAETIQAITRAGIPVCAHIGLTPQSVHAMGGYRMHGKTDAEAEYLLESAKAVEKAGAFAVVLECIQADLAEKITKSISIPTIGIGSGTVCDGEVLVIHDLVGLTVGRVPRFVHPEADFKTNLKKAVQAFIARTQNPSQDSKTEAASSTSKGEDDVVSY